MPTNRRTRYDEIGEILFPGNTDYIYLSEFGEALIKHRQHTRMNNLFVYFFLFYKHLRAKTTDMY